MSFFNIDPALRQLCAKAEEKAAASFRRIDSIAQYNSEKVLSAFINNHVSESHFAASTGYGYGDRGREVLDQVLAEILGCEDALIRYIRHPRADRCFVRRSAPGRPDGQPDRSAV